MFLQTLAYDAQTDTTCAPPKQTPSDNPFPYGWRYVTKQLPSGEELFDRVPLTLTDLLNPQLEDQMPQRHRHFHSILDLAASLKTYYANDPTVGVFGDLIMDWGIPDLEKPAPDIAIVPHLHNKDADRGTFNVVQEGTRPCLVIEVMSPNYPVDDKEKVRIYEQAGVAEYLLINPHAGPTVPHYELKGYHLVDGVYQKMVPDRWGRLLSQTLQLWFGVYDHGTRVRVKEVQTKRWLLTPTEEQLARVTAETLAQTEATARQAEREARLAAEARAQTEERARLDAEVRANTEERARQDAEARVVAEATARAQLEQRVRELEARLKTKVRKK